MSHRVRRRRLRAYDVGDERPDVLREREDRPRRFSAGWPPLPPWGYYGPPPWVREGLTRMRDLDSDDLDRPLRSEGVDVFETDDEWIIEAELPGVSREDISVEVRGDVMRITAPADRDSEREGARRRSGRREGFDYRVELPDEVDEEGISANLDSGILTVSVPRTARRPGRRIEIRE